MHYLVVPQELFLSGMCLRVQYIDQTTLVLLGT